MKLGTEDQKKLKLLGVVGAGALIAIYFLYGELFGGPSTPPAAPPVVLTRSVAPSTSPGRTVATPTGSAVSGTAAKVGSAGTALDPTLHMEAMQRTESLVYSGSGRNIFASPGSVPVSGPSIVQAKFPARPKAALGEPPPVYTGPPPPPVIALKFFGTVTSANGILKAFLLNGDNVFLALPGDVVERRYRVVSIAATSITVEDLSNRNTQTLPLLATP